MTVNDVSTCGLVDVTGYVEDSNDFYDHISDVQVIDSNDNIVAYVGDLVKVNDDDYSNGFSIDAPFDYNQKYNLVGLVGEYYTISDTFSVQSVTCSTGKECINGLCVSPGGGASCNSDCSSTGGFYSNLITSTFYNDYFYCSYSNGDGCLEKSNIVTCSGTTTSLDKSKGQTTCNVNCGDKRCDSSEQTCGKLGSICGQTGCSLDCKDASGYWSYSCSASDC